MRGDRKTPTSMFKLAPVILASSLVLAGCGQDAATATPPAPRPVRATTIVKRETATPLTFTGRIEAEDEVSLAFRISGRLLTNDTKIGDRVKAGQLLARLESQNELNTLRQAQAALAAAQGVNGKPMETRQADYFAAYRNLKLSRDQNGVLVAEFHSDAGPTR